MRRLAVELGIAAAGLALLALGGLVGWRALMRFFVRRYYKESYHPLELQAKDIGAYPEEHHLDDVPWIAARERVCQSTSLQMIAAQHGIAKPRRHFDFLMGFTYGAGGIPGGLGFYPGTDPEPGFVTAAPHLGLERHFYVTDDARLYLDALRYYLSQGHPVRVGLDMAVLYDDLDAAVPHSDVLVGYKAAGFYYYETVCLPEVLCKPGHWPPGEAGIFVASDRLLEAVTGQARLFEYPWRYSLSVFEPGPLEQDLGPIWARNGQSLIGGVQYGPPQGADVIDNLASQIEVQGAKVDVTEIRPGLRTAVYVRLENATYLREAFPGEADLEESATLFGQSAGNYRMALEALEDGIADAAEARKIAAWLRDAAAAERAIGEIFLARSQ